MKKLNTLLSKLDSEFPRVTKQFKHKDLGKVVQVIMSSIDDPYMGKMIKDKNKTGITINNQDDFEIIEVLYADDKQKKECEKELYNILVDLIKGKIIYVGCVSQEKVKKKESLVMQFLIMEIVEPIEI